MNASTQRSMICHISSNKSVGDGIGERCFSQSNFLVASVVDGVMSLKESHAKDGKLTRIIEGINNQINSSGNTTNDSVQATRPYLSVRDDFEYSLNKKKKIMMNMISQLLVNDA
jgi:hypothetical protein